MRQESIKLIPTQAGANVSSSAVFAANLLYCSAQITATGTEVGSLKLQASNDNLDAVPSSTPTNWSDIPSATVAVSSAGAYLIPSTQICYQYVRLVYTHTSGSGNITAVFKSIGA